MLASPRPGLAARLAVALVSVAIFFGLAEAGLRLAWRPAEPPDSSGEEFRQLVRSIDSDAPCYLFDPVLLWRIDPIGGPMRLEKADAYINRLGLRAEELPAERDERELRVVCIGDSVTYGYAVATAEAWPARLEAALRGAFPDRPVRVVNAGVPGYTSRQCLEWLRAVGMGLEPDVVTFCSGFNDARQFFYSDAQVIAPGRSLGRLTAALDRSRLVQFLRAGLRRLRDRAVPAETERRARLARFLELAGWEDEFWGNERYRELPRYATYEKEMTELLTDCRARVSPEEYRANVAAMAELARAGGAALVLIESPFQRPTQVPYFLSFRMEFPIERYREELRWAAAEHDLRCVRVPILSEAAAAENAGLFYDIVHPNRDGCAVLAPAVAEAVVGALPGGKP